MTMTFAGEDLDMLLEDTATEPERVSSNRYNEARAAGLSPPEARHFAASHVDIGWLRTMVAGGADADLIARTLL